MGIKVLVLLLLALSFEGTLAEVAGAHVVGAHARDIANNQHGTPVIHAPTPSPPTIAHTRRPPRRIGMGTNHPRKHKHYVLLRDDDMFMSFLRMAGAIQMHQDENAVLKAELERLKKERGIPLSPEPPALVTPNLISTTASTTTTTTTGSISANECTAIGPGRVGHVTCLRTNRETSDGMPGNGGALPETWVEGTYGTRGVQYFTNPELAPEGENRNAYVGDGSRCSECGVIGAEQVTNLSAPFLLCDPGSKGFLALSSSTTYQVVDRGRDGIGDAEPKQLAFGKCVVEGNHPYCREIKADDPQLANYCRQLSLACYLPYVARTGNNPLTGDNQFFRRIPKACATFVPDYGAAPTLPHDEPQEPKTPHEVGLDANENVPRVTFYWQETDLTRPTRPVRPEYWSRQPLGLMSKECTADGACTAKPLWACSRTINMADCVDNTGDQKKAHFRVSTDRNSMGNPWAKALASEIHPRNLTNDAEGAERQTSLNMHNLVWHLDKDIEESCKTANNWYTRQANDGLQGYECTYTVRKCDSPATYVTTSNAEANTYTEERPTDWCGGDFGWEVGSTGTVSVVRETSGTGVMVLITTPRVKECGSDPDSSTLNALCGCPEPNHHISIIDGTKSCKPCPIGDYEENFHMPDAFPVVQGCFAHGAEVTQYGVGMTVADTRYPRCDNGNVEVHVMTTPAVILWNSFLTFTGGGVASTSEAGISGILNGLVLAGPWTVMTHKYIGTSRSCIRFCGSGGYIPGEFVCGMPRPRSNGTGVTDIKFGELVNDFQPCGCDVDEEILTVERSYPINDPSWVPCTEQIMIERQVCSSCPNGKSRPADIMDWSPDHRSEDTTNLCFDRAATIPNALQSPIAQYGIILSFLLLSLVVMMVVMMSADGGTESAVVDDAVGEQSTFSSLQAFFTKLSSSLQAFFSKPNMMKFLSTMGMLLAPILLMFFILILVTFVA